MPCSRSSIWLLALFITCPAAAEPITVTLVNGRKVSGEVDRRTNQQRLWLRREEAGIQLKSGLDWSEIRHGLVAGKWQSHDQLRASVLDIASTAQPTDELESFPAPADRELPAVKYRAALPDELGHHATGRVASLRVDACLGQWDDDAFVDGLLIRVYPLDARGQIVPVNGELTFTLMGQVVPLSLGSPAQFAPQFRELECGHQLVRKSDFMDGPAVYQLAFDRLQPERDVNVDWSALLHARLGVVGQGAFKASAVDVPIRDFSHLRTQLQFYTRQRYAPREIEGIPPH